MKANRTHQFPPKIEDLGDGSFYYNFNIEETERNEEGQEPFMNYDYDQVRCRFKIVNGEKTADPADIQECLDREGYDHQVKLE